MVKLIFNTDSIIYVNDNYVSGVSALVGVGLICISQMLPLAGFV